LSNDAKALLVETVKVAVVAWVTFLLTPLIQQAVPWMPEILLYLVEALAIAFLISLAWLKATAVAQLTVLWRSEDHLEIDLQQVIVDLDPQTKEARTPFWVLVQRGPSAGLGAWALRTAVRQGLTLHIEVEHSRLIIAIDMQADISGEYVRIENDRSIEFELRPPVPGVGKEWVAGKFDFGGGGVRPTAPRGLSYSLTSKTRIGRWCIKRIKIDAKAVSLVENWS
jgi:hypothetical protein